MTLKMKASTEVSPIWAPTPACPTGMGIHRLADVSKPPTSRLPSLQYGDAEQPPAGATARPRPDAPDHYGEIARLEPPLGEPDKKDALRVAVGNEQRRKIMDRDCRG
ncbi:hypothetical protein [Mesorhizobium sp. J428]|uniref:hypothetical protein n=1 Tax=Mesorhizobium sp. J428 TaxID=2898440 RepID=UPI002151C6DF|nr:hypothetical protein [Mesorhizobium sp. J428]MCR5857987.1 hypothetical protein [Mesorhizobium sp. J428]